MISSKKRLFTEETAGNFFLHHSHYSELRNTKEIRERFLQNNLQRRKRGLPLIPLDELAVTAMGEMDPCSGVAIGIDRLLMYLSGEKNITRGINFARDYRQN